MEITFIITSVLISIAAAMPAGNTTARDLQVYAGPFNSRWTNYDAGIGASACGPNFGGKAIAAVGAQFWRSANPNTDPLCSKTATVTSNGKTFTFPIKDKCGACGDNHIDLSYTAAKKFGGWVGPLNPGWRAAVWQIN